MAASIYDPARYYKPYVSDDSELESESDSDGYISEESLLNVPGKHAPILSEVYDDANIPPSGISRGTEFRSVESRNTSLFMINSRDRDTRAYPQPTFFTIRLPRTFKNIKQINLTQLNLLNSFFNFTKDKGNTWMYVYELGRTITDPVTGSNLGSNAVKIQIRDGTYTADDLVLELNNALNATPIFADITLGDFISQFQASGDFTLLFNTPGAIVFNSLTQAYERNQTINNIVARYFTTVQSTGIVTYSYDQCLVAYYYPVIKEMIIESPTPTFNTIQTEPPPGFASWYDYLLFAFQGLNDPYVTAMVQDSANQVLFNRYRYERTFNFFLVNKYTTSYNAKQGRLNITATSLNDSIVNDLNTQYGSILNDLVVQGGFSNTANFQAQLSNINNLNGSLVEFYNFIQSRFTNYFGVNYGQYTAEFYANSNNEITLYNTLNKYGWDLTLTPQVSASSISGVVLPEQTPNYWPNIGIDQSEAALSNIQFVSTTKLDSSYQPFGPPSFFPNDVLEFPGSGETTFGYFDLSFAIVPTTYQRAIFKTRCRQNISMMTIPRFQNEKGPGTDMVFDLGSTLTQTPILYDFNPIAPGIDATYISIDISGNPLFYFYTVQQSMLHSPDYMRAYDEWLNFMVPQSLAGISVQDYDTNFNQRPSILDIGLSSFRPFQFFQVNADKYLVAPNAHFRITFFCETQGGTTGGPNFPVPIVITWYKDRAAFMADASQDLAGNLSFENPRHYFQRQVYGTNTKSAQMTVDVNNDQQTYFMVHVLDRNIVPASIPLRVFCVLTDVYGDYREATRTDFFDLPFTNLPPIADQFTPACNVYADPLKSIYREEIFQLGYDLSGVSNNLLDYTIQTGTNLYYDPRNIQDFENAVSTGLRFQFNNVSPASGQPPANISSTKWSLYFGSNQSNRILDTYNVAQNTYLSSLQTPKSLKAPFTNEFTIVNWFKAENTELLEYFLLPGVNTNYATKISSSSVFLPCINPNTPLEADSATSNIPDISGMTGITFYLPPNQIAKLNSLTIKFAYTQPVSDNLSNFRRSYSPFLYNGQEYNQCFYRNQSTDIDVQKSDINSWDDWYLYNRRNVKIGIYPTYVILPSPVSSGVPVSKLGFSELQTKPLFSMTLKNITQVASYQNKLGTLRTREPEWGTYYNYEFDPVSTMVWSVSSSRVNYSGGPDEQYWCSTLSFVDIAPTYTDGENVYPDYFLTNPVIKNYTYLPRSVGIAPAVGNAVDNPSTIVSYTEDLTNGYTAVPFYWDEVTQEWVAGSFYGVSFTIKPAMVPLSNLGAAPYYGPPGIFALTLNQSNLFMVLHPGLGGGFHPYYFNTKITYDKLDIEYNPATDLVRFGGYDEIKEEYQDTVMFLYSNASPSDYTTGDDLKDISTIVGSSNKWIWGMESNTNYVAYDDQGGYNFLSYIYSFSVRPTDGDYAVHVRAYDPIPGFNTGIRFIGKNYTDFGNPTLTEMIQEISTLEKYTYISDSLASSWMDTWVYSNDFSEYNITISTNNAYREANFFSHEYADALKVFDVSFSTTATFGKTLSYNGLTLTFADFADCILQYSTQFTTIRNQYLVFTNILSTASGQLNDYIEDRYSNILPPSVLNRNRVTDPLPFQLLLESKLEEPYKSRFDEWGLGYNLGFDKRDTAPPRTTVVSDTFIRITQDYIYLRLNPEFNINTMGVSSKENFAETMDPTSEDQKYFSKIILNNFGSFCRTAVQLPKQFQPVLGKYDTISCQLVDRNGAQISSLDCEYDFVLELTEIVNGPTDSSSLLGPTSDLAVYTEPRKGVRMALAKKK
jgi:hypothetical protein